MNVQKIMPKSPESLKEAEKVTDFSNHYIRQAAQDLLDTLAAQQAELDRIHPGMGGGVGLASNQIEYPYQPTSEMDPTPAPGFYPENFTPPWMYVISIRPERARQESCDVVPPTVYINADYEPLSDNSLQEYMEGCLSIVGVQALNVPRNKAIGVIAQTIDGEAIYFEARNFIARVHQHEQDHCHGHEYLNQLYFNSDELEAIQAWILKNKQNPTHEKGTVIVNNLICNGDPVDYDALAAWVEGEVLTHQHACLMSR